MGYRSEVVFAIRGKKDAITAFLVKQRLTQPDVVDDPCWKDIKVSGDGAVIHFHAPDVKWCPGYPGVQFFERFWSDAEAYGGDFTEELQDGVLEGGFARLGEEDDDTDTRYFGEEGYDLVSISRAIRCDYI